MLYDRESWLPLVHILRATAPEGTRSVEFRGTLYPRSYGGSCYYDPDPGYTPSTRGPEPMDALALLREHVADAGVAVRALVPVIGEARISLVAGDQGVTFGLGSGVLENVNLAPDTDPEPYRRRPVQHPDLTVSPYADPAAVTALVRRVMPDAQPATETALAEAEARLGMRLPDDVRAMYLAADSGDLVLGNEDDDDGLFHGMRLERLDNLQPIVPRHRYGVWRFGATVVVATDAEQRIEPLAVSPAWIPLGDDWGGNLYVVDLAPGPGGHIGQILHIDHEINSGAQWVAASLTELLTRRRVDMVEPTTPEDLMVRVADHTGRTLAEVTSQTEVLYIQPMAEPVDLAPLAGHPRIRSLITESAAVTGLSTVALLPALEYLELDVAGWRQLLDALPSSLVVAGLCGRADWDEMIAVVQDLLAARGRPPLRVLEL